MEEREEGGHAREGEAESSRPRTSVKACLYSVRKKNFNMSLLIRSPFLSAGKESDDSIPPFLLILPHQQHVISDCGVCLWLMLQSRRNNERVRRDGGTGRWGSEEESHGRVLTDQSIDISTWLNLKKVCT